MSALIREIYRRRELLLMLAGRNLKIRYKNSTLGFFWSLLVPLIFIAIYATFAKILRFNEGNPAYLQFLIVGIVMWQFIGMCLNDSLNAINGNANLVKKTAFARIILPLSTIVANFANFLLTAIVLAVYLLAVGMKMQALAFLPLVLATQFALGLGLGLLVSTSNVFFRDTEHMIGIFSLAWFFLTPIFYPVALQFAQIPEKWHGLVFPQSDDRNPESLPGHPDVQSHAGVAPAAGLVRGLLAAARGAAWWCSSRRNRNLRDVL